MLAASRLQEEYDGIMWFPGQNKIFWATAPASAVASARAEQLAHASEKMFGLLSDLPESEHELSFSDLVVVSDQDKAAADDVVDQEEVASAGAVSSDAAESGGGPADHKGRRHEGVASIKDVDLGLSSKRRRSRSGGGAVGSGLQPAVVKTNRSSCSGSAGGGEGVLLNLYMPCSLTRSLTSGSSSRSRRYSSARERPVTSTATISEGTQKAKLSCWSSIWATKEKQHNAKGSSSRTTEEKGKNGRDNKNKKKKVQSVGRDSRETFV